MNKILIIVIIILFLSPLIASCVTPSNPKQDVANQLSAEIKLTGPIDSSIFEDYTKFQDWIDHINTIIRITNDEFHTNINEVDSSSSNYEEFKRLMRYSPLIGSYNDLYNSAILLPSANDSDYTNFYANLTKFFIDFCWIDSQLSYHIAYTTTGDVVSTFGLDELAPYVGGDAAFSEIESGIHWGIRGLTDNLPDNLVNFIENYVNVTNSSI